MRNERDSPQIKPSSVMLFFFHSPVFFMIPLPNLFEEPIKNLINVVLDLI